MTFCSILCWQRKYNIFYMEYDIKMGNSSKNKKGTQKVASGMKKGIYCYQSHATVTPILSALFWIVCKSCH